MYHRLRNYGHDVAHVDLSDGVSKGDRDTDLAAFSLAETRVVVTYDDDFFEFDPATYHECCSSKTSGCRLGRWPTSSTASRNTTTRPT